MDPGYDRDHGTSEKGAGIPRGSRIGVSKVVTVDIDSRLTPKGEKFVVGSLPVAVAGAKLAKSSFLVHGVRANPEGSKIGGFLGTQIL